MQRQEETAAKPLILDENVTFNSIEKLLKYYKNRDESSEADIHKSICLSLAHQDHLSALLLTDILEHIKQKLISDPHLKKLNIDIDEVALSGKTIKSLAAIIQEGEYLDEFCFGVGNINIIEDTSKESFHEWPARLIQPTSLKKFTFLFNGDQNEIDFICWRNWISSFAEAIENEKSPASISLSLCDMQIGEENMNRLMSALGNCRDPSKKIFLNLAGTGITSQNIRTLTESLKTNHSPQELEISFSQKESLGIIRDQFQTSDIRLLMEAIKRRKKQGKITILFDDCNEDETNFIPTERGESIKLLVDAAQQCCFLYLHINNSDSKNEVYKVFNLCNARNTLIENLIANHPEFKSLILALAMKRIENDEPNNCSPFQRTVFSLAHLSLFSVLKNTQKTEMGEIHKAIADLSVFFANFNNTEGRTQNLLACSQSDIKKCMLEPEVVEKLSANAKNQRANIERKVNNIQISIQNGSIIPPNKIKKIERWKNLILSNETDLVLINMKITIQQLDHLLVPFNLPEELKEKLIDLCLLLAKLKSQNIEIDPLPHTGLEVLSFEDDNEEIAESKKRSCL